MKSSCTFVSVMSDSKARLYLCSVLVSAFLISCFYFTGSVFFAGNYRLLSGFGINGTQRDANYDNCKISGRLGKGVYAGGNKDSEKCADKCKPLGSEALPEGIVAKTSNFEMRPLFGDVDEKTSLTGSVSLLAMPVGIKQKELVNQIIQKFLEDNFVVILFHYDAIVDKWNDLEWSNRVIHISALNQTKWWFAKRFLHPDIVSEYEYIFLWDEDLGVENFHPGRYVSIVKEEGLEISQPALDPAKSRVHQQITLRNRYSRVHRRYYKLRGGGRCDENSTAPPCVGYTLYSSLNLSIFLLVSETDCSFLLLCRWVEMMAPVFSRAAWRCTWYMIQNDLIHAWGLDRLLGYCAQGDRTAKVGVVDEEYIVHMGLPTLGGVSGGNKVDNETVEHSSQPQKLVNSESLETEEVKSDNRSAVRKQSYIEMAKFQKRWNNAIKKDKCWVDPYSDLKKQEGH
ncbi:OLC1v1038855C1 [Oldenlandia corymbosa var. corymbosa]|uniref:OLC1v1038855C1 n=1 Tax=Oldenlandia corymbosa var. corymbosa TaxID=529605 RepID=A0AAV1D0U7_OLDCO|nr:OLC1v1038855C1 [Oldenlandia corymbosa var. corymbosa]